MSQPATTPIGVVLARTAKTASRVFDQALAAAGGSQPVWQILISLKTSPVANQRELAEAVSMQGATLLEAAAAFTPEQPDLRVLVDGRGTWVPQLIGFLGRVSG